MAELLAGVLIEAVGAMVVAVLATLVRRWFGARPSMSVPPAFA